ncbi:OLC1v1002083C1 [Oldenlandia corymbosa var. corymbosa]|uniref:OLC1v1002083C1 n=1 Tax=Oldenlandia corymbosa var. corymbosa TaxID=529605 RepID=A0AAV1DA96_OLDCO|nr:OLC1v1002083C1 [Oldenlandia corymbosa var. corymbosa]
MEISDAESNRRLGNARFKEKNYNAAIEYYSNSIGLLPTAESYANRALAYIKMKRYQEAEIDCTEALKLNRSCLNAYESRLYARRQLGKFDKSLEDANVCLSLKPNDQKIEKEIAELRILVQEEAARKVSDANSLKNLGDEQFELLNYGQTIKFYSESIDLNPTAIVYAKRALAYIKIKRFSEAENDCAEALSLNSGYSEAYFFRSLARKELGKVQDSIKDAISGLELNPENTELRQHCEELKALVEQGGEHVFLDINGGIAKYCSTLESAASQASKELKMSTKGLVREIEKLGSMLVMNMIVCFMVLCGCPMGKTFRLYLMGVFLLVGGYLIINAWGSMRVINNDIELERDKISDLKTNILLLREKVFEKGVWNILTKTDAMLKSLVVKDNVRFHIVFAVVILLLLGVVLPLTYFLLKDKEEGGTELGDEAIRMLVGEFSRRASST